MICARRRGGRSAGGWLCGEWAGGSSVRFCSLPPVARGRGRVVFGLGAPRGGDAFGGLGSDLLRPSAANSFAAAAGLWWPPWAGGAVQARVGVLLPLRLGRCRCGSWRAADSASGRGVDMFFGVGAVRAAAVTNHIGTSMGTLRAWIPYFFPRR